MRSIAKLGNVFLSIAYALGDTIPPDGTLELTNQLIAPDGFARPASVLNGIHPGPVVVLDKGDSVRINVVNNLNDPAMILGTTIHWHGMFQRKTNFMDGTDSVTQCPIAPGNSFVYQFDTTETGTFWYHSHFGIQYCDGVRGGFIIYDPLDPHRKLYDVDDESTIISINEWYHTLAVDIKGIAKADSTLINGRGRYPGGPPVDLAVIGVELGKRYRLRIISMSCDPFYMFSIDNHDLIVIEVEGVSSIPYLVNTIPIYAGQRYSVVLRANRPIDNYWIRALPNSGNRNLNSTFKNGVNSAILRYRGAPVMEPITKQQPEKRALVETKLRPLKPTPPPAADADFTFIFGLTPDNKHFTVNGTVFVGPDVPILLQILRGTPPEKLLPKGSIYPVERHRTVQVNIPVFMPGAPHPMHLHGHNFWVVRSADSNSTNDINPIIRDTVNGGGTNGDYISIRFRTDNPGPWIFHCHNDFHLVEGLAIVFAEATKDVAGYLDPIPDEWNELCEIWENQPSNVKNAGQNGGS